MARPPVIPDAVMTEIIQLLKSRGINPTVRLLRDCPLLSIGSDRAQALLVGATAQEPSFIAEGRESDSGTALSEAWNTITAQSDLSTPATLMARVGTPDKQSTSSQTAFAVGPGATVKLQQGEAPVASVNPPDGTSEIARLRAETDDLRRKIDALEVELSAFRELGHLYGSPMAIAQQLHEAAATQRELTLVRGASALDGARMWSSFAQLQAGWERERALFERLISSGAQQLPASKNEPQQHGRTGKSSRPSKGEDLRPRLPGLQLSPEDQDAGAVATAPEAEADERQEVLGGGLHEVSVETSTSPTESAPS